jgi:hypothetical protein
MISCVIDNTDLDKGECIMTSEEAMVMYKSGWYEDKTAQEIVEFQLYEDRICMPFFLYQKAVEEVLGRPVYTHEFAELDRLIAEYEEIKNADCCLEIQGSELTQW